MLPPVKWLFGTAPPLRLLIRQSFYKNYFLLIAYPEMARSDEATQLAKKVAPAQLHWERVSRPQMTAQDIDQLGRLWPINAKKSHPKGLAASSEQF